MRANLYLDRLRAGPDDGGVNRTVSVVLRGCNVVVELPGNELPQRVHHPERRIAFGYRVHEDTSGANVHELLEGELLRLHLAPNAIDVFRSSLDRRFDAGSVQSAS